MSEEEWYEAQLEDAERWEAEQEEITLKTENNDETE